MATVGGIIGGHGCCSLFEMKKDLKKKKNKRNESNGFRINCVSTVSDPYKTLRIHPGASESEVKKAFRQLALQYHPDVCRGSNCGIQFHQINQAYDAVMSSLREEDPSEADAGIDEPMRGMYDQDWDMWEEWMGWEGAGIRDYSSHINPYI